MLENQKKKWMFEVAESVKESEILSLESDDQFIEGSSSLLVSSPSFDSDYIKGEVPENHRNNMELSIRTEYERKEDYIFQIRPSNYSFRQKVVGLEIIERILQDDKIGTVGAVDYTASKKGVEMIMDSPEQPKLFNNLSTNVWKLYKTVKLSEDRYKFVYRQMGDKPSESLIQRMSKTRIQRILWDVRLNCVNCSEFNSVAYAPTSMDETGFTFQCEECNSEWDYTGRPSEKIPQNQKRGFINSKLKQFYQTAVGSP